MSPTRTWLACRDRSIPSAVRIRTSARGDPIGLEPVIARVSCRRLIGADRNGAV